MAIPAQAYVEIKSKADAGLLDGQKKKPIYWIEVTKGSGWFAVMLWDGMGYAEPWETGIGRYNSREEALVEAKEWAEAEGISCRSS